MDIITGVQEAYNSKIIPVKQKNQSCHAINKTCKKPIKPDQQKNQTCRTLTMAKKSNLLNKKSNLQNTSYNSKIPSKTKIQSCKTKITTQEIKPVLRKSQFINPTCKTKIINLRNPAKRFKFENHVHKIDMIYIG